MEKSKKKLIVKSVTELVNKLLWDKTQDERTQQIAMLSIDKFEKLNKSDVISSVSESGIRLDLDKMLKAKDTFKNIL